jgi:malonyl CoA-acyl carrier protein transacylase
MWFLNRLQGEAGNYNVPVAYRVRGEVDVVALGRAVNDVIAQHEVLRTVFPARAGRPRQVVREPAAAWVELECVEVAAGEVSGVLAAAAAYPFDLTGEIPVRAWLLRLSAREHVLVLVVHHIACDGWSLGPLLRDLGVAYRARRGGGVPEFVELPVQYADFALWQRELLGDPDDPGSAAGRQLAFWRRELAGLPEGLDLDVFGERLGGSSVLGGRVVGEVPVGVHRLLCGLARGAGCSLFMVVQAVLGVLLARHGAGGDVPVGTPVAGRVEPSLDDVVGFFVNTVVLRVRMSGDPTFRELLSRVRSTDLSAFTHQDVPFDQVVRVVNPRRSVRRHPLFQVMFAFQSYAVAELVLEGLSVTPEYLTERTTRFDLRLEVVERLAPGGAPDGIEVALTHALDLVSTEAAERLLQEFIELLATVPAEPDRHIQGIGRAGDARPAPAAPVRRAGRGGRAAFVCSPYGQQWVGMGRKLFETASTFRETVAACDAELSRLAGWSLVRELFLGEPEARTGDVGVMQPVVLALQLGLASWLEEQGVRPVGVTGHSLGEIAACTVAGILELPEAVRIAYHYSDQQRRVASAGRGMAVVELSVAELEEFLAEFGGRSTIAAMNGPRTTALAGERTELEAAVTELQARDIPGSLIRVDLPAHSPAIEPVMLDLEREIGPVSSRPGRIPMVSSVTGQPLRWHEVDAGYFARNLRQPVRLADATARLLADGCDVLVEVSTHPVLAPALEQSVLAAGSSAVVVPTMRRAPDDRDGLRQALVELARLGFPVSAAGFDEGPSDS